MPTNPAPTIIHEFEDPATGVRMYQLENDNIVDADECDALFAQSGFEDITDDLATTEDI